MFSFNRIVKYEVSFFVVLFVYRFIFGTAVSGISLSEVLILFAFLVIFFVRSVGKTEQKRGSLWEKMNIVTKILITLIVFFLMYWAIQALAYIIGAILVLVAVGFALSSGDGGALKYTQWRHDIETGVKDGVGEALKKHGF